jgi:hypothetical protein
MSQTRRLAAIRAADVAGYSRLMGAIPRWHFNVLQSTLQQGTPCAGLTRASTFLTCGSLYFNEVAGSRAKPGYGVCRRRRVG